jgi:D-alanine transaminase
LAPPLPICHLNGELLPLGQARISPLDRCFLFGDGVYEVIPVYAGRPFRCAAHLARLSHSCQAIRLRNPHTDRGWQDLCRALLERNGVAGAGDAYLYLQISRGADSGRNHAPLPDLEPTVFAFVAPWPQRAAATLATGVACVTAADTRWARCDVKSVALLANVLLRQLAVDAGASETLLLRDGELTEASASTVHVVLAGEVLTPPNSARILPGTTRSVVEELCGSLGIAHRAAAVSEAQLRSAEEIWLAAATRELDAVTCLDGRAVGGGVPGPQWHRVYDAFQQMKRQLSGTPW